MINNLLTNKANKDNVEKQVLLLEDAENRRGFDVNNMISPDNKNSRIEKKAHLEKLQLEKEKNLITKYKGTRLFTLEQILEDCEKYDLTLFSSQLFTGELSLEFGKKLDQFCKENTLLQSDYMYGNSIFFLAPRPYNSFKSNKYSIRNKDTHIPNNKVSNPLTFIKIEEDDGVHYILVDEKIKYNNILNRIWGYFMFDQIASFLMYFILTFLFCTVIFSHFLYSYYENYFGWIGASSAISLVVSGILSWFISENNRAYYRYDLEKNNFLKESIFFISVGVILHIMIGNILFNFQLQNKGDIVKVDTEDKTIYKKEVQSMNYNFVDGKEHTIHYKVTTHYYPGIIFYNKDVEKTFVNITFK